MNDNLDLTEILRDCPKGMELDCTMFENCTFNGIEDVGYINILVKTPNGLIKLSKEGCFVHHCSGAKCVIFPKGKTTWEGFVPPYMFKDGDIVIDTCYNNICIYKGLIGNNSDKVDYYVGLIFSYNHLDIKICGDEYFGYISNKRLATEEEKQKLFDALKANGYKWNAETKTLEKLIKPKFKVGDRIRLKGQQVLDVTICQINSDCYTVKEYLEDQATIDFEHQDKYELVPNKFDITTLKPFDKVLVRNNNSCVWICNLYSHYSNYPYHYICIGTGYKQCIPYNDETKHLLRTTDDCPEYYKTW